ncbi:MAG: ribbon-helix-helix protein, CopG family [Deltaproteobacteria bacterium]|nr:ribbon-helix-helix protein, CopG family [Deltaproteobacteria bacterium]
MSKAIKNVANFHVPLPEAMYKVLREEADRAKQPATELAREAIAEFLEKKKRKVLHEEIAAYAKNYSGHSDFDEDLERSSVKFISDKENE